MIAEGAKIQNSRPKKVISCGISP